MGESVCFLLRFVVFTYRVALKDSSPSALGSRQTVHLLFRGTSRGNAIRTVPIGVTRSAHVGPPFMNLNFHSGLRYLLFEHPNGKAYQGRPRRRVSRFDLPASNGATPSLQASLRRDPLVYQ